jgi:hypothetical protein
MRYPVGFGPLFLLGEGLESRHEGGNRNQVLNAQPELRTGHGIVSRRTRY